MGPRPAGAAWDRFSDVVLYNAAQLPAAATSWQASRRVRTERTAWRALAGALLLSALANVLRTLAAGTEGNGPYPAPIDGLAFAAYLLLYVTMVALIRSRVPCLHPSMWLAAVIGALGTMALGVAFLIAPYIDPAAGRPPLPIVELALPAADLLLLSLLVAVGSSSACDWTGRCCSSSAPVHGLPRRRLPVLADGAGHLRRRRPARAHLADRPGTRGTGRAHRPAAAGAPGPRPGRPARSPPPCGRTGCLPRR